MKHSIIQKLESLADRFEEVGNLLSQPDVLADQQQFRTLSMEFSRLEPIVKCLHDYQQTLSQIDSAKELIQDPDADLQAMALEELEQTNSRKNTLELELQKHLLPTDPNDERNIFLEIRAGTGGDEAALFAGDLFRMYNRYAENHKWKIEILSERTGEYGGYKEIIARVVGKRVFSQLKFESGAHRVQRVPETEAQGRIHTSAATVAVLPELEEAQEVDINPAELKVDTYRASGAGGQHVNKTDSAVRLTHIPSGIVVECQDERSQHKNKARAMSLLAAKLLSVEQEKLQAQQTETRRNLVGSGDRSERIRTYNFPQGRVTDHRINLTLYKLDSILQGNLDSIIEPLTNEDQADRLAALSQV